MSDRADQLRDALAYWDRFGPARGPSDPGTPLSEMVKLIAAARSYLAILESSDELVEEAAKAIDALGFDTLELRNWGQESVPGATEIVARAALSVLFGEEE